jgi:hypothetical protein
MLDMFQTWLTWFIVIPTHQTTLTWSSIFLWEWFEYTSSYTFQNKAIVGTDRLYLDAIPQEDNDSGWTSSSCSSPHENGDFTTDVFCQNAKQLQEDLPPM